MRPVALVLGDYRQTLAVVRALDGRGYRVVAGIADSAPSQVRWSRRVSQRWQHPQIDEDFAPVLREAIERFRPAVVFPVGDREIAWFGRHRDELPDVPIAAPDVAITTECQDKVALMRRAGDHGVPHAPYRVVASPAELQAAVEEIGFPVFVKPHDPLLRIFGEKGIGCDDEQALAARFAEWPEPHRKLIVQRYAHGPRHNVYFAAHRGELLGAVEVEIIRTDRRDGTGLAVDGRAVAPNPELIAATETLAESMKYTGVGCTQFLVAGDGTVSFLELNPRLGANYVVAHRAGLDLASIAVDLARDRNVVVPPLRTGVRYAWTLGDIDGLKEEIRGGGLESGDVVRWIGALIATAARARVHVTWKLDDPAPALVLAYRSLLRPLVRRLRGR